MEATAKSFSFLTQEGAVIVPFFQRAYVWGEENWDELLDDLFDNGKSHFLGSIILKQTPVASGNVKEVLIIDGQQRLTTLSILIRAIYDTVSDESKGKIKGYVNQCLMYQTDPFSDKWFVKIRHSKIDRKYYEAVIKGEYYSDEKTDSNNIVRCYKHFLKRLKDAPVEKCEKLFSSLVTNIDNKILVVIDLTDADNEQSIFDTINSAGVRLSSADIIKNALFQKALDLYSEEEVVNLHTEYWENIFSEDTETVEYWSTERTLGRIKRDNLEILLHSIAVINGFFDPEKHSLSDITDVYKNYFKSFDVKSLLDFLKSLKSYASLYKQKMYSFSVGEEFEFNKPEKRLMHILSVCEISTFNPYILYLYNKYSDDGETLQKLLRELEIYVIRRFICNLTAKNYNKICKDCIDDEDKIRNLLINESEMNDANFEAAFKKVNNKQAALILFWIELYKRSVDKKYDLKKLSYKYTLEHIMPQKWEEYWSSVPVVGEDGEVIKDKEKAKQYRYEMIYNIGNMTLLNKSLNTSLRNYEIARKINGEGKRKGIKDYADITLTKDIIRKYDESTDKKWDEADIRNRFSELTKDAKTIWHI